jgi:AcrR family transcriptional regulator
MKQVSKNDTSDKILKTAGILFSQRGYLGVSMSQIAHEVGITKAALYYHFESKEELYLAVLKETFSSLSSVLERAFRSPKTPLAKLFNVLETYLTFTLERPEASLLARCETGDAPLADFSLQVQSQLTRFLKKIVSTLGKGSQISEEKIVFLVSLLLQTFSWPFTLTSSTPQEVTSTLVELFFPRATLNVPKKIKENV